MSGHETHGPPPEARVAVPIKRSSEAMTIGLSLVIFGLIFMLIPTTTQFHEPAETHH